jgi:hypothetical protein
MLVASPTADKNRPLDYLTLYRRLDELKAETIQRLGVAIPESSTARVNVGIDPESMLVLISLEISKI